MFNKLIGSLVGVGFLLSLTSGTVLAQKMEVEMPVSASEQTSSFRQIEQPLGTKIAVTLGGLGLVGVELWWFLMSKNRAATAKASQGVQEVEITVDGGYEPSHVVVEAGQPVQLNFLRRDRSSCLEKVILPDFGIAQDLTLDQVTTIELTPQKAGRYQFTCGMNMFRGVLEVRSPESSEQAS